MSIIEKLNEFTNSHEITFTESEIIDLFGINYKEKMIEGVNPSWKYIPFEENESIYVIYLLVVDREYKTFRVQKPYREEHFYCKPDDQLLIIFKEYRAHYQQELKALEQIFSHKTVRIKSIF